jgi:tetratricopeptide (TPR) repeat protein
MMPYDSNPHFLGRDDLLKSLKDKLKETKPKQYNHRVAIYGMGGVGKTQVAIEYVYRHENDYDNVYWISASDQAALLSGFQEVGTRTGCLVSADIQDPTAVAKSVLSWLRTQERWLLVVDNLDDVSVADGLLPATDIGGHTLITTRNPDAKRIPAEGLEIPLLGRDDSIELLRVRSEITEDEIHSFNVVAADIVHELGYHALAIEHAAAFIRSTNLEIAKFLQIYHESRKHVLSRESTSKHVYPNSLVATFLLSFDKVKQNHVYGQPASLLLQFFAFLNPDGILVDFLQAGSPGLREELRKTIEDGIIFQESLGLLQQFSLIGRSRKGSIVVHRLIQAVIKDDLTEREMHQYWEDVLDICNAALPKEWYTPETRMLWRSFQSQVVEPAFEATKTQSQQAGITMDRIGVFLREDGKFKDSERLNSRSVKILEEFGKEHPKTLWSMNNLASTYWHQGKLQDAADLQESVLEAMRRTLGEEHPDTLKSMSNLASTYWKQGKLQDAADLHESVLEAMRRTLGEEHPDTLTSMNNLALTYQQLQDAADLQERLLEAMRRTLGEEHPGTLTSMNNLAWTYEQQEKVQEALTLIQKSVDGSQRTLGEDHPSTTDREITLARLRDKVRSVDHAI